MDIIYLNIDVCVPATNIYTYRDRYYTTLPDIMLFFLIKVSYVITVYYIVLYYLIYRILHLYMHNVYMYGGMHAVPYMNICTWVYRCPCICVYAGVYANVCN